MLFNLESVGSLCCLYVHLLTFNILGDENQTPVKIVTQRKYDRDKIRQFMKTKREKEIKARKQMEADQVKAKLQLKDRLMSLDLKAISAAQATVGKVRTLFLSWSYERTLQLLGS